MRGTIIHGARDVRFEQRDDPGFIKPTDAIMVSFVSKASTSAGAATRPPDLT